MCQQIIIRKMSNLNNFILNKHRITKIQKKERKKFN